MKERNEAQRSLNAVEAALQGAPYSSEGLSPLAVSVILPLAERVRREAESRECPTVDLAEATERATTREEELLAEIERLRAAEQAAKKDVANFCARSLTAWLAADGPRRALVEQLIYAVEGGRIPAREAVPALHDVNQLAELILAAPYVNL